ncbi:hypothetical protein D3C78_1771060 [compost metagenome]
MTITERGSSAVVSPYSKMTTVSSSAENVTALAIVNSASLPKRRITARYMPRRMNSGKATTGAAMNNQAWLAKG